MSPIDEYGEDLPVKHPILCTECHQSPSGRSILCEGMVFPFLCANTSPDPIAIPDAIAMSPETPNREAGPSLSGTEFTPAGGAPVAAGASPGVRGTKTKPKVARGTSTLAWWHWTTPGEEYLDVVRQLGPIVLDPFSNPADQVKAQWRIFYESAWTFSRKREDGTIVTEPLPVPEAYWSDPTTIRTSAMRIRWCSALRLHGVQGGVIFNNPPYGPFLNLGPDSIGYGLRYLVEQGKLAAMHGFDLVALLPTSTDTRWWHYVAQRNTIGHFWKGRLAFGNPSPKHKGDKSPGGGNYTAYFGPNPGRFIEVFSPHGECFAPIRRI